MSEDHHEAKVQALRDARRPLNEIVARTQFRPDEAGRGSTDAALSTRFARIARVVAMRRAQAAAGQDSARYRWQITDGKDNTRD